MGSLWANFGKGGEVACTVVAPMGLTQIWFAAWMKTPTCFRR